MIRETAAAYIWVLVFEKVLDAAHASPFFHCRRGECCVSRCAWDCGSEENVRVIGSEETWQRGEMMKKHYSLSLMISLFFISY
jgi:hypothetical protein